MANDEPESDEAKLAAERRRKRPAPTIELTATEVDPPPERKTDNTVPPTRETTELPFGVTWPMLGVAAGTVLVVLAVLLLAGVIGGRNEDSALIARLAAIEAQLAQRGAPAPTVDPKLVDDLNTRLAKAEQALASPRGATDPTLLARLDAAETAMKVLMDSVASLNRRSDDGAALLRETRERVDAMAKTLGELSQRAGGADRTQVEQLAGRIAALERAGKTMETELRSENATSDRAVRLAVATSALKSAAERGTPFTAELAAVRPQVEAKVLEPLSAFASSGVPSTAALAQELSALVPALLRVANPQQQDGTLLDRLQSGAGRLVRIRPIDEAPGDDASAVIARIEGKAKRADISGALEDLAKLPPNVRAPADAWVKKMQARSAALDAAQKLAADAFAALGKPSQ
jgi:hypothetical protein